MFLLNILPVIIFYLIISAPIYGQQDSLSVVRACDFDSSGVIDVGDFLLFVDSFGTDEEKYDLDRKWYGCSRGFSDIS